MTVWICWACQPFCVIKEIRMCLFVLSWSVWRSLWGTSMDDDCLLCLGASTLKLVVAVAQVGTSDGQRLSRMADARARGEIGSSSLNVESYSPLTVVCRWKCSQLCQSSDEGGFTKTGNLLLPHGVSSTFKRPWRSGREPVNRSFTACYHETTQLRGPGFAPPGVQPFFALFFSFCPVAPPRPKLGCW